MSKNQIYIYFLIPIIFGLLESEIIKSKIKFKKHFSLMLIFVIKIFLLKLHPSNIPTIYAKEYHRISIEKNCIATGSKLLMNI